MLSLIDLRVLNEISKRKPIYQVIKQSGLYPSSFYSRLRKFERNGLVIQVSKRPSIYDITLSGGSLLFLLNRHKGVLS